MPTSLLIIDDSAFSRNMIRRSLPPEWEVEVSEASSGWEALEKCESRQYDVIFLDITMPDMDGLDVLLEFKHRNFSSKIFVVSADVQTSSRDIAIERGAIDYLKKPIKANKLQSMLKKHEVI